MRAAFIHQVAPPESIRYGEIPAVVRDILVDALCTTSAAITASVGTTCAPAPYPPNK